MKVRICRVLFTTTSGIRRSAEIQADSLYEAAVEGIKAISQQGEQTGPVTPIAVEVKAPTVVHEREQARRLLASELLDALLRDYKINAKDYGWCERVTRKHLRPFFGEMRAAQLRHDLGKKYHE